MAGSSTSASRWLRLFTFAVVILSSPIWLPLTCPLAMRVVTIDTRTLIDLKNRTAQPMPEDFDSRVTLEALLTPGADRSRWSTARAAAIEGYVLDVHTAGTELANCFRWDRRDVHIDIGLQPAAPPRQRLVLEVTPPMRDWARVRGLDWSSDWLRTLIGRRVRFEGWLLFDWEHDDESENSRPGQPGNWRATAWEVHPITSIAPQ